MPLLSTDDLPVQGPEDSQHHLGSHLALVNLEVL